MKKQSVLILGGGASGLAAAVVAAEQGAKVTLLERNDRVGKKLLATGNGRCNLANIGKPSYFGDASFAEAVLKNLPAGELLSMFERLGVPTRPDSAGRVYPACNQAAAVLDALRMRLEMEKVQVFCGCEAASIGKSNGGYEVRCKNGQMFAADRVIVCCGGLAAPKLGAADSYRLLTKLGCDLVPTAPALTPLETEKSAVRGLSGQRLPATLTLCDGKNPVARTQGEVLFADYGLSGVCAMQLARDCGNILRTGGHPVVYMDFSPTLGIGEYRMERRPAGDIYENLTAVRKFLADRSAFLPENDLLLGAMPRLLREKFVKLRGENLAKALCASPFPITGVRDYGQAQVTQGGISTRFFSPDTLECKKLPGLYACGEILNVDGDCGGFNLMFAFACGILAGRAAAGN